jgi:nucleoside-diphosphate-sugar epimerase
MRKAFITGGAGFIGSRVVREFLAADYEVMVFDSFKQYVAPDPHAEPINLLARLADISEDISLVTGDTLNKDFLRRALNRFKPDVVVHMAALPLANVAIEQTEEAFDSILVSTVNILEIVRDFDHECPVLYTSSSMVYGDFKTPSVTEEAPKDPKDIYGSIKLAGEIISAGYRKRYGIDVRTVRPTAVYGPYDANQRVLYKFITRALKGEPLTIDGDGSMALDFTYVDDTANGIFRIATTDAAKGETFNIARGKSESLSTAVSIISETIGDVKVEYGEVPAHIPSRGTLDVTKARELLGFEPQYGLERALPAYIQHLRNNPI